MKKFFFSLVAIIGIAISSYSQIPSIGLINNKCLDNDFKASSSFNQIVAQSVNCLNSSGLNIDEKSSSAIAEKLSSLNSSSSQDLYEKLLSVYKQGKSSLAIEYANQIDNILSVINDLPNIANENKELYDNAIVKQFESIRSNINKSKLTNDEFTQLNNTIDIAIGSAIYWHDYQSGQNVQAKKWWQQIVTFVGNDVLGAGAVMQVTYSALPPQAYVAAGLACSAYNMLYP